MNKRGLALTTSSKILASLDIIVAILIIVFASTLIKTPLGKIAITFGFVMLAITTILKILQKEIDHYELVINMGNQDQQLIDIHEILLDIKSEILKKYPELA